jgi:hypothetical protein
VTYLVDREVIRAAAAVVAAGYAAAAAVLFVEGIRLPSPPAPAGGGTPAGPGGPDWKWWLRAVGGTLLVVGVAAAAWYLWGPAGSPPPGGATAGEVVTAVPTASVVEAVTAAAPVETSAVGRFVIERAAAEVVEDLTATVPAAFHEDILRYVHPAGLADLATRPDGVARANEAMTYLSTPDGYLRMRSAVSKTYFAALDLAHANAVARRPSGMPAAAVANLEWPRGTARPVQWNLADPARFAVRFARSAAATPAEWLATAKDTRAYPDLADQLVAALERIEPLYQRNLAVLNRDGGFATFFANHNATNAPLTRGFYDALLKSTGLPRGHSDLKGFPYQLHFTALFAENEPAVAAQLAVKGLNASFAPEVLFKGVKFDSYVKLAGQDWAYFLHARQTGMGTAEFLRGYPARMGGLWSYRWSQECSTRPFPPLDPARLARHADYFRLAVNQYLWYSKDHSSDLESNHKVFHLFLKQSIQDRRPPG